MLYLLAVVHLLYLRIDIKHGNALPAVPSGSFQIHRQSIVIDCLQCAVHTFLEIEDICYYKIYMSAHQQ